MDERLLKPAEVAEILQVSMSAAYKILRRGEIPTVRFGTMVLVKRADLERYIYEKTKLGIKGKGKNASSASQ
jgi:excisionase family DNA binding protein